MRIRPVEPDVRGAGIGRMLMAAAERWARDRGYAELENRASHQAHRALGFEEVERTVHFRKAL
jgi:aminoglycoside 6'-N-acetyltransferase I